MGSEDLRPRGRALLGKGLGAQARGQPGEAVDLIATAVRAACLLGTGDPLYQDSLQLPGKAQVWDGRPSEAVATLEAARELMEAGGSGARLGSSPVPRPWGTS